MGIETTTKNFNDQYANKGGVATLLELYRQGLSSPNIGKVFELEGKQIDYYLKRIVGQDYIAYPWRKTMSDQGVGPRVDNLDE